MKLYQFWPSEGFASPIFSDAENPVGQKYHSTPFFSKPLAKDWETPHRRFQKDKKADGIPTIMRGTSLLLPQDVALKLFGEAPTDLEFLPEIIDEQPWTHVHTLRQSARFDESSSPDVFLATLPDGAPPLLIAARWINIIDPSAMALDLFTMKGVLNSLLITESLVDRIRELGLVGVDFHHIGHLVADASQAVPAPPEQPDASAQIKQRSKRDKPIQLLPMESNTLAALQTQGSFLRAELGLSANTQAPDVLKSLTQRIEALRPKFTELVTNGKGQDTVVQLSAVYADLLVLVCGWSYMDLSPKRGSRYYGVVSPDRAYALSLEPYMRKQLEGSGDITLTLQFNMIQAGNLPPGGSAEMPMVLG